MSKFFKQKTDPAAEQLTPYYHQDHRRPVTRRELIGQGFMAGVGIVALPSIISLLLEREALAKEGLLCMSGGVAGAARPTPFLVFDLSGGGNIPGSNVIVGKRGGQEDFLTTYSTLGLPDALHPKNAGQTNNEYGLLFHADSAILKGMNGVTTAPTRAAIDGTVFCTASNDDSGNNPHNPMYWILKAASPGELISLAGTRSSASGGNSAAPADSINAAAKPVIITKPGDVLGLVNPGKLAQLLSAKDVEKVLAAARGMSASKLDLFQRKDLAEQVRDLVECGYMNGGELVAKAANADLLDPTKDAQVTGIFKTLAAGQTQNKDEARVASIAKLVLEGKAAAGTIEMAGFDYHDGTRTTGEAKDLNLGKLIGQVLELAAVKKSDLMVYVFTDGGVTSNGKPDATGKGGWQADSGQRSAAFTLVYNKDGTRPKLAKDGRRQIGAFMDAGGVDQTVNKISNSVDSLARAVTANYLALNGMTDKFASIVKNDPFGPDLATEYLAFQKLR